MLKKVFGSAIIISVLFSCQISRDETKSKQEITKSDNIKPEEKIIANSRVSLKEFLIKTFEKFKAYAETSPYPEKGEFESTEEYKARISNWRTRGGIFAESYKATNLFPVELGEYNADSELFFNTSIELTSFNEIVDQLAARWRDWVNIDCFSLLETVKFPDGWHMPLIFYNFKCPREKARKFRAEANKLRCDIVFKLSYTPDYIYPGSSRKNFTFNLYGIKLYLPETGEILLETSYKK